MTKFYLSIFTLLIPYLSFAQENDIARNCSRTKSALSHARVSYYQFNTMDKYDVKYIKLDINVETASRFISGNCLTRVITNSQLDSFVTEFKSNMIVDSVFLNGIKKTFSVGNNHLFVPVSPALAPSQSLSVQVFYKGTAGSLGVYAGTATGTGGSSLNYTATLSESYQAREWFPCKQILTDKIDSTEIWVTTSSVNKVGSNGLLQGVDVLPSGKVRYRWKTTYPMNYYLLSFAVGNYSQYINYAKPTTMAPDSILVQHYIAGGSYINSVRTNLDKTPRFMEKMSELYGLYPFWREKYGHAQAMIGGGMEHQTMSTMSNFGTSLIAHELGHQWFGDHVTCAKWNDIFVNEGFATYSEYLMMEKLPSLFTTTTAAAYMNTMHNNIMSASNGSVFVPNSSLFDEDRIFDSRLSYDKGAAIVHNLRFEMQSDSLFFKTLKQYQQQFQNSTATGDDFKIVAENLCGRSFNDFFSQWYYGEGYPTYNINWYKPTADSIIFQVNETVSAPNVTPFFKGFLEIKINYTGGDTTFILNLDRNDQEFIFFCSRNPTSLIIDPNNWIINKTGSITNVSVLPVKFISFNGSANKDCSYNLNWITQNEMNISSYQLEISNDGLNFTPVNNPIIPANQSNNTYTIQHFDSNFTRCYFRIRVNKSGSNPFYSSTILLNSLCEKRSLDFSATLKPEIIDGSTELTILAPTTDKADLSIYSSSAQLLYREEKLLNGFVNKFKLPLLQKLSPGIYYLIIITGSGFQKTIRFIKRA